MTTYADFLGLRGRSDLGSGFSMPPGAVPGTRILDYEFSGGMSRLQHKAASTPTHAIELLDTEPTRIGRLIRGPGVTLKNTEVRIMLSMFQQTGLDANSTLILLAPPEIGSKAGINNFINWSNPGLAAVTDAALQYVAMNYGDDLLFSNTSSKVYTRNAISAVTTDVTASVPVARSYATAFGRVFAGGVKNPTYQALGMQWNGSSGLLTDWVGLGSGGELLIADVNVADSIVAVRAFGLDGLAILCRGSLWAGYPTGIDNRPADFRLRFTGLGCVSELTVATTPGGITFLSQNGVVNYNLSEATIISHEINDDLLPLDPIFLSAGWYRGAYEPVRRRYYLQTTQGLWIYEFPNPQDNIPGRWTKRSLGGGLFGSVTCIAVFKDIWNQPLMFFNNGIKLYHEDYAAGGNDIAPLTPHYVLPSAPDLNFDDFVTTVGLWITYKAASPCTITIASRDRDNAELQSGGVFILAKTNDLVERFVPMHITGCGSGLDIQPDASTPGLEIARIRQAVLAGGPSIGSLTTT